MVMDKIIPKSEFKPKAFELFRYVESTGKALIISDHGKPVLKISPVRDEEADGTSAFRNTVISYDRPLDPVMENEWEALK